ncbi:hypothetical protein [Crenobacter cavernae]|uniref:Type II secretion system protein M n=1 Tax=Crenobacter cavernae TaxID=2290923 RepID=A0ABY0FB73_9NEIS|nr:hypothetical protein [Crenobacter cavernae]RXZ43210.1 hypothetical protein EBB06_10610 [Crenobacter cavernae]
MNPDLIKARSRHAAIKLRSYLTPPLLVGLAFLCAALMAEPLWLAPERETLAERAADAEAALALLPPPRPVAKPPAAKALSEDPAVRVARVFAVLVKQGFSVDEARYSRSEDGKLAVELPLAGGYPRLRKTLAELSDEPGVKVGRLAISRDAMGSAKVAVTLRIVLEAPR